MLTTYVNRAGEEVSLHVCDSKDDEHLAVPRLATRRLFWVTGPVEYCGPCAAWMKQVADTLGVYVHEEDIPLPLNPEDRRGLALTARIP